MTGIHVRVPAICPDCEVVLGFENTAQEAIDHAMQAKKEGYHSKEFCEKQQAKKGAKK